MNVVLLFAKYPVAGKVKTRLGNTIGMEQACALYKKWLQDKVQDLSGREYTVIITGFSQEHTESFQKLFPKMTMLSRQGDSLGEMMLNATKTAFTEYKKVILIGADCPNLTHNIVMNAWMKLETHDIVLGPDTSGGMYLIGLSRPVDIFSGILYSQDTDYEQTLALCRKKHYTLQSLPQLIDIDTEADLLRWQTNTMGHSTMR